MDIRAGVSNGVDGPAVASQILESYDAHEVEATNGTSRVVDETKETEAAEETKSTDYTHDIELEYELLPLLASPTDSDEEIAPSGSQDCHSEDEASLEQMATESQPRQALSQTETQTADLEAEEAKPSNTTDLVNADVEELKKRHTIHVYATDGGAKPTGALEDCDFASQDSRSPGRHSDPNPSTGFVRARVRDLSQRIERKGASALGPTILTGAASVPLSMWRKPLYYDMTSIDDKRHQGKSTEPAPFELSHVAQATLPALGASGLEEIIAKVAKEKVRQLLDERLPDMEARVAKRCEAAAREAWQSLTGESGGVPTQAGPESCTGSVVPAAEVTSRFLESQCLEMQDAVARCMHLLNDAQACLKRLAVGSHVQVVETGRLGELVLDDGSEKPYKVNFDDGQEPRCMWYKPAEVRAADMAAVAAFQQSKRRRVRVPSALAFWTRKAFSARPALNHSQTLTSPPISSSGTPASQALPEAAAAVTTTTTTPHPTPKFEVGDHVRLVNGGRRGEVIMADDSELPYKVRFLDNLLPFADWHRAFEIESCSEAMM